MHYLREKLKNIHEYGSNHEDNDSNRINREDNKLNKGQRQALIKKIISENKVTNQSMLLKLLEEAGVETTQATISRDIREANIIKTQGEDGKSIYKVWREFDSKKQVVSDEEKLTVYLNDSLISLARVEFMNVIKLLPGHGQSIGFLIDEISFENVVATVAGDDTVLLISQNVEEAIQVHDYFQSLVS